MVSAKGKIKGNRAELISYLLNSRNNYVLREISDNKWHFRKDNLDVIVSKEEFTLFPKENLEVDESVLSFTDFLCLEGYCTIDKRIRVSDRVDHLIEHLVEQGFLSQLAILMDEVTSLEYSYTTYDGFRLHVDGTIKTENFASFKLVFKKMSDEAVTYAIAHSLVQK